MKPAGLAALAAAVTLTATLTQPPSMQWQPLDSGVTVRLRGVSAVTADVVWASGERGTVLRTGDGGPTWQPQAIPGAEALDFRDIDAVDAHTATVLSIGPGEASRIYRTVDAGTRWTLQFVNDDPKAFLDAMAFADPARGVAVSDSVDGRFVVLLTADGGRTWTRVPAERLPPARPGEGAFAASGTNIAVHGRHIWIGTTASRVLQSPDAGRTWRVVDTPVATGEATGIFSIAFRNARHGVVVGGTHTREHEALDNVASTIDGGATWTRADRVDGGLGRARGGLSGYRSAVASMGALGGAGWLAVGPSGADLSTSDGYSWTPAGGEGYDALSVAPGGRVGFATGSRGRIARVTMR